LLVGLISDERDTSFIIKISLTALPGQIAYLEGNHNMLEDDSNQCSDLCVHYKKGG
jgi:hypothetical protein